jgi:DNA polymerase III alpha subunit
MLINNIEDLIEGVQRHGPSILKNCVSSDPAVAQYYQHIVDEFLNYPIPKSNFDKIEWMIPLAYQNLDIEAFLINQCPKENYDRLIKEIALFKQNNMIDVLKCMKYIVDTLRANNILWGVGRGSSVASYALHLIGVHKIDSVKYNLPIEEFFKEI